VEGSGRGLFLRCHPGIGLEGLRKTMKNLIENSLSPGRDLNSRLSEYEGEMLTTRPRLSVELHTVHINFGAFVSTLGAGVA
jgi:hypothetical protein